MLPTLPVLSWLLLHAATVQPTSVPAQGSREALVTLDAPAMVHLEVSGGRGTACQLVDQLRGPFASAGSPGRARCVLDQLLDASTYKLRLSSPRRGKGQLTVHATPFPEQNARPVRLEPHREVTQSLHPAQQASYWLHLDKRQPVTLRVSGRTAGVAKLWRSGTWLEPVDFRDTLVFPRAGQGIHEQWFEAPLDAGDYLLVVYGANVQPWTQGTASDGLTVAYGLGAAHGSFAEVAFPESGVATLELPKGDRYILVERTAGEGLTQVAVSGMVNGQTVVASPTNQCFIQPKALEPSCTLGSAGRDGTALLLRGTPGTRALVQWLPRGAGANAYGDGRLDQRFLLDGTEHAGTYFVGTHELPLGSDQEPLACALVEQVSEDNRRIIAWDTLQVGPQRPFARSFNYDGSSSALWFQVTAADTYELKTSGGRKSSCTLLRQQEDGTTAVVEGTGANATANCSLTRTLSPGRYVLDITGGVAGIEHLQIARPQSGVLADTATHVACNLGTLRLEERVTYTVVLSRHDGVVARGLVVRPTPVDLDAGLLPLALEGKASSALRLGLRGAVEVRGPSDRHFRCSTGSLRVDAKDGMCRLNGDGGPLTLENLDLEPVSLNVGRPITAPAPAPLMEFSPQLTAPPKLAVDATRYLDFHQGEAHSFIFDVTQAGLYEVSTEGLLATSCWLRSPVVTSIPADTTGGRGRNCRASSFLRPGRYLFTAAAQGDSVGRAGMTLARGAVQTVPPIRDRGETFAGVTAGQLVEEELAVSHRGTYLLGTETQSAALTCRLEDGQGWPLLTVPAPCRLEQALEAGTYRWLQLPITVESVRHTDLARKPRPVTLRGGGPFKLALNQTADVVLGKKGADVFAFSLSAEQDVHVALDHAMQGRLFRVDAKGTRTIVDLVRPERAEAPPEAASPAEEGDGSGDDAPPEAETAEAPSEESPSSEAEGGEANGEQPADESGGDTRLPAPALMPPGLVLTTTPAAPLAPLAPGARNSFHLGAGSYELVTQHSQGDVAIHYTVLVSSDVLSPGVSKSLTVPSSVWVRLGAESGILRIATHGNVPTHCRVFNAWGARVAESTRGGADWNCSLTQPLPRGDYRLDLEAEANRAGSTELSVSTPEVKNVGSLVNDSALALGTDILRFSAGTTNTDGVWEASFTAPSGLSCALEGKAGALLDTRVDVRHCELAWRGDPDAFPAVRLWTSGDATKVHATFRFRPLQAGGREANDKVSALVKIDRPGRYFTGKGARCRLANEQGPLHVCGPVTSLEAGSYLFIAGEHGNFGTHLREDVVNANQPSQEAVTLFPGDGIERAHSRANALHLLTVQLGKGESFAPRCSLNGEGFRELREGRCDAAASGEDALGRWSAREVTSAQVQRSSISLEKLPRLALGAGPQSLDWSGADVRLTSAVTPARVELTLGAGTWALELDASGRVVTGCSPSDALARCTLQARGGSIVLHSPNGSHADAVVIVGETARTALELSSLLELEPHGEALPPIHFARASTVRQLHVEGRRHCLTTLDDGTRTHGCEQELPANVSGRLEVELSPSPLRVALATWAEQPQARFGAKPVGNAASQATASAFGLFGNQVEKQLQLAATGVVHVQAESGVCALFAGGKLRSSHGLADGCDLYLVAEAGTYQLVIRGFAREALHGTARWTLEPLATLGAGVGKPVWLGPSTRRFFQFKVDNNGEVGLGVREPSDVLTCAVRDVEGHALGTGCQQLLTLPAGFYTLEVATPAGVNPVSIQPVLLGLTTPREQIPPEYLQDLFTRLGVTP